MTYSELEHQGKIKPYQARATEIQQLLKVAARDLATGIRNLDDDPDWAFSIAYNAVLQAARALMFHRGYRPRGQDQHHTVVRFAELTLGEESRKQVAYFDQMRRKRHRVVYEAVGLISRQEAEQALDFCRKFVEEIGLFITGQPHLGTGG